MNRVVKPFLVLLVASIFGLGACWSCMAQSTPQPCPVSYSRLQMPLRHAGGISTPMVQLSFTNESKKTITRAKFGLIVINEDGSLNPYEKGLTFSAGAEPGKVVSAEWALEMGKIDLQHMGETVYITSAEFADGTSWKDDGNQRCRDDIYFGPK
jgi:hypothetical protein